MSSEVHTPLPVTAPRPLSRRSRPLCSGTAFAPALDPPQTADRPPAKSPPPTLTGWSLDALSGRLVEISASGTTAALTVTCDLVLQAQLKGEPGAWITLLDSSFFPPDAACSGIDLDALPVIRVPDPQAAARAADKLARSGGFGLIVIDLTTASAAEQPWELNGTSRQTYRADSTPRTSPSPQSCPPASAQPYPPDAAQLYSTGTAPRTPTVTNVSRHRPFPRMAPGVPMPLQSRLLGLARKHQTAIVFLTEKDEHAPSLGPLVSLRAEARRKRSSDGTFTCEIRVIKDKRHGPGRSHRQTYHGPAGLR